MAAEGALFDAAATVPVPWWRRRLCGIDCETTREHWVDGEGPDVNEERIVSCAVAMVGGGGETWSHTWLVNPGFRIPPESTAIHGIHDEDVADAPAWADVADDVLSVLDDAAEQRIPLVAYNAAYDLTVLDRNLKRVGMDPSGLWQLLRVVDPMLIDRMIDTYRKGSRKLADTAAIWAARMQRQGLLAAGIDPREVLGRERDGAHEAAQDAIAACRLAWLLAGKAEPVPGWNQAEATVQAREWARCRDDLDLLHDWQRRWRREDQERLREHWRAQGNPKWEGVRPEWPVYPEGVKVG